MDGSEGPIVSAKISVRSPRYPRGRDALKPEKKHTAEQSELRTPHSRCITSIVRECISGWNCGDAFGCNERSGCEASSKKLVSAASRRSPLLSSVDRNKSVANAKASPSSRTSGSVGQQSALLLSQAGAHCFLRGHLQLVIQSRKKPQRKQRSEQKPSGRRFFSRQWPQR